MSTEHDPYSDTARPAAVVNLRKQQADDIRWLVSTKQGRRVAARLIEHTGVYRNSFTGNSETFFKEGMRNVGLFLVAEIRKHAPESYAQIVNENTPA
jgi:hypothetical protein